MSEEDGGGGAVTHGLAGIGVLLVGLARVCSSGGDDLVRVGAQVGRHAADVGHVGGVVDDVARGAARAGAGASLDDAARSTGSMGGGFGPRGAVVAEPHPPTNAATGGAVDGAEHGPGWRDAVENGGDAVDLLSNDDEEPQRGR
jgi:hypothetical protein